MLRTVPTNSKVFLRGFTEYAGKADLNKCYRNPKRKLLVTSHFSKLINQQYLLKALKYKAMYGVLFQIEA